MKIPFLALLFGGIPEQIALVYLAFVIANVPIKWKEIVPIGLCLALVAYVLRLLPITFGVHTIILIGLLFVILIFFYKISISTSILASLISFLALILFETTFLILIKVLFDITLITLENNVPIRIFTTWPQIISLFLTAFIINKWKKVKGRR
ncbi:MAG: hypothetical protein GX434_05075 [Peptococcaceae bacterium]|nr:hypothetical protein [Peptococcaceae bacterium]